MKDGKICEIGDKDVMLDKILNRSLCPMGVDCCE